MIEIRVLQAHQGDCIWVRCVSEKTVNIVIDVGTSTFKREFKNLVEEINNKNCDLFGQKIAEQLNTYILKQKLIKNQCDFLQNKFNDYQSITTGSNQPDM